MSLLPVPTMIHEPWHGYTCSPTHINNNFYKEADLSSEFFLIVKEMNVHVTVVACVQVLVHDHMCAHIGWKSASDVYLDFFDTCLTRTWGSPTSLSWLLSAWHIYVFLTPQHWYCTCALYLAFYVDPGGSNSGQCQTIYQLSYLLNHDHNLYFYFLICILF